MVWVAGFRGWRLGVGGSVLRLSDEDAKFMMQDSPFGVWCSEEGSYLRLIDLCITQLQAESNKEEEEVWCSRCFTNKRGLRVVLCLPSLD